MAAAEPNDILRNLHQKKQNLRRIASEVGSMASELRQVRSRMAAQEALLEQETRKRLSAEAKATSMENELELLQRNLQERDSQVLQSNDDAPEQYIQEPRDDQIGLEVAVQTAAEGSSSSVNSAHLQCATLLNEIENKGRALQEHEVCVMKLGQQLIELQHDLKEREVLHRQLRDEVEKMEVEIKLTVSEAAAARDNNLRKLLEEVSSRNDEQLAKHVNAKDEDIARLREEIRLTSTQFKFKVQELEVQLDKHRRVDQEMKKRILKLEFWLQEARSQTRKLQRATEKKDKEIKDLRAQLWLKEAKSADSKWGFNFWDSPQLKILMSVSVVVLVFLARR